MKKINSNGPGTVVFMCSMLFLIGIPALMYIVSFIFNMGNKLFLPAKISAAAGGIILAGLIIVIVVELKQDKRLNIYYVSNRNRKIKISEGFYECQNCGSRTVRENDNTCGVCGIKFKL